MPSKEEIDFRMVSVPESILQCPVLEPIDKLVYCVLMTEKATSVHSLARRIRVTEKTIEQSLKALVKFEFLEDRGDGYAFLSPEYFSEFSHYNPCLLGVGREAA